MVKLVKWPWEGKFPGNFSKLFAEVYPLPQTYPRWQALVEPGYQAPVKEAILCKSEGQDMSRRRKAGSKEKGRKKCWAVVHILPLYLLLFLLLENKQKSFLFV